MSTTLLKSGLVGTIGTDQTKMIREEVINRWEGLGLLKGLHGHTKETIAQLFENQAKHMLDESTTLGSEGSFETVVFPMVRRIFGKLLANEIVSVQALSMPIGKVFYYYPQYGQSQFGLPNGAAMSSNNPRDQRSMVTGENYTDNVNLYDAYYDNGLFDNSKGLATLHTVTTATSQSGNGPGEILDNTYVYSRTSADGFVVTSATSISSGQTAIIKAVLTQANPASEDFLASLDLFSGDTRLDFNLALNKYSKSILSPNKEIYISVTNPGTAALPLSGITITYKSYEDLELSDRMGSVSFDIVSENVAVEKRMLRANWSPELQQDVMAFQNIDAEAELTAMLSEQIAAEIDREIIRDLLGAAPFRLTWDYKGFTGRGIDAATPGAFYTQKSWNQTLITAINQISAQINKSTLRGGATFIVCSAEASTIFDDLENFHVSNAAPEQDKYNLGIEKIGVLGGRFTVYKDPFMRADEILIGYKGSSVLDSGYVYAPYVPLQLTPTLYNPQTFAPTKGISTRYAKKVLNARFYGKINVKNVVTFGTDLLR